MKDTELVCKLKGCIVAYMQRNVLFGIVACMLRKVLFGTVGVWGGGCKE